MNVRVIRGSFTALVIASMALAACGGSTGDRDAAADGPRDVAVDGPLDATVDAPRDVAEDAAPDRSDAVSNDGLVGADGDASREGDDASDGDAPDESASEDALAPCQNAPVQISTFTFASEVPVSGTQALAAGDFDGDGKADVAMGTTSGIRVRLGQGAGMFGSEAKSGAGFVTAIATGDFDGNGKLDLVAANREKSAVSVFLGNGDGTFQVAVDYATDWFTTSVTTEDFNGDGKLDLAVAPFNGYLVDVLLGVGDGTFRAAVHYPTATAGRNVVSYNPATVAAGDFNGDSKADVVLAYAGGVSVFLGNGDGTLRLGNAYTTIGSGVAVTVGDWDRDGKVDLAVAGNGVGILAGNGDGTFQPSIGHDVGHDATELVASDLNGDGTPDLVAVGSSGARLLFGNGRGRFQASELADPKGGWHVAAADWDGDGRPDLALLKPLTQSALYVFLGDAAPAPVDAGVCPVDRPDAGTTTPGTDAGRCVVDGGVIPPGVISFRSAADYIAGAGPTGAATGDFNGDGITDVAAASSVGISVLLGNADGTLRPEVQYGPGNAVAVAGADLNGDGKLDLVAARPDVNTVGVYLGLGDGTFQSVIDGPPSATPVLAGQSSVATADFDGDGKIDVALTVSSGKVSIFRGMGTGMLEAPASYSAGGAFVTAGDVNGDSKIDLVTASLGAGSVNVLLGKGDGAFAAPVSYPSGSDAGAVVIGDWDGDRKMDLAVTGGGVGVLMGNGDGSFQAPILYDPTGSSAAIAAGDWNGDGKIDLAVTGGELKIMLGDGRGAFQRAASYGIRDGSALLAMGDWNRDGRPDLAVVARTTSSVGLFLNGGGGFQAAASYGVSSVPSGIAPGDWNGDGKIDLATTGHGPPGTINVLIGNGAGTFAPAVRYRVDGDAPEGIVAGDWNGDGKIDLAAADNESTSKVNVLLGNGDGTFQTAVAYSCMAWSGALVRGDWNRDAKLDLAVAGSQGVSVLLGNGDGTFQRGNDYDTWGSNGPFNDSLVAGDWNHNGTLGVAVAHNRGMANGTVDVRRYNGAGAFGKPDTYTVDLGTRSVAAGDWNGDGYPDLVTVYASQFMDANHVTRDFGGFTVLTNRGDGKFSTFSPTGAAQDGHPLDRVVTGDWNADGKADLAITDLSTRLVKVHLGNGDGTFRSPLSFGAGAAPSVMAVADLDGDGLADLVVGDASKPIVRVLLNASRDCRSGAP
jgi:hypothetical protein